MPHKRIILLTMLLAWMPLRSAHAEDAGTVDFRTMVNTISRDYRQGAYEQALYRIQLGRQSSLMSSELMTLSLYEGIVLYCLGRQEEAQIAFEVVLMGRADAKLPEPVSPKIEDYFKAIREKLYPPPPPPQPPGPTERSPPPPECIPPSRIAASGRTLKAQQLWRVSSMGQLLCARRLLRHAQAETLRALKEQIREAATGTEWMRLSQDLDRFAHEYAVYPTNEDWRLVRSFVQEHLWEPGDIEQNVLLPEEPIRPVVESLPAQDSTAGVVQTRGGATL